MNQGSIECLYITFVVSGKKLTVKKLPTFSFELYHTTIKSIESYVVMNKKFNNLKASVLWQTGWVTLDLQ